MAAGRNKVAGVVAGDQTASALPSALQAADDQSRAVLDAILASGSVKANVIPKMQLPTVSVSECNLPGILGLASRYGRFAVAFSKQRVFQLGGRPCRYVDQASYSAMVSAAQGGTAGADWQLTLSKILNPPGSGGVVQDFTHEREWRVGCDLPISDAVALVVATPADDTKLQGIPAGVPVFPLTMLYEMGA